MNGTLRGLSNDQHPNPRSRIRKVLVANRGEIAVRIIRTCREMEIGTVAIYSDPDVSALHVQMADEAYPVGPAPALQSYLNVPGILEVARESGADAIHPGYGFLAENAEFARAVRDFGITWIGPSPEAIALMGDKVAAKALAAQTGVPIVPGYMGDDQSIERIAHEAELAGYPVMLKAAAGGGGKGMRAVHAANDLPSALEGARREAQSAFGDPRVFLEKLVERPRHIEFQVVADTFGNAIHLGERDCTLQRRHQKVVEESPSPVLTADLREQMGEAALRLVRASEYVNAGTVEFLFGSDRFYFLEMNTRIQVEHPVTELVTGLDLVRLQIEIASGLKLSLSQADVTLRGHSLEVRLYAENPERGFLPATGRIQLFESAQGPSIRNDVGVFAGGDVLPYYDPMLSKIVAYAATREQCVAKMREALAETSVLGVHTNLQFLRWLMDHPDVCSGHVDTAFIDDHWEPVSQAVPPDSILVAAAAVEIGVPASGPQTSTAPPPNPWRLAGGWRVGGAARTFTFQVGEDRYSIEATRADAGRWTLTSASSVYTVQIERPSPDILVLRAGGEVQRFVVASTDSGIEIDDGRTIWRLDKPALETSSGGASVHTAGRESLGAPMPGTVIKVEVQPGESVTEHAPLIVLEAMKMEHVIQAPRAGVVRDVMCKVGDLVQAGEPLVDLEEL